MFNANELSFFLMDNMQEGILIFDEQLTVVYANKNAEKYLQLAHHEMMAKSCEDILDGLFCGPGSLLEDAMSSDKTVQKQIRLSDHSFWISAQSFKAKEGEESHKVILIQPADLGSSKSSKQLNMQKKEIIAKDFGEGIIENIQDLSEAKNIPVTLEVNDPIDPIYADETSLEYTLMNLLSKAINFSDKGTIILHIGERETGNSHLFKIENPDEKIPAEDFNALIQSFSKGTDKAKNAVEEHGGKLWLETETGFAINFTLPKNL